jgi:hypothetical protein
MVGLYIGGMIGLSKREKKERKSAIRVEEGFEHKFFLLKCICAFSLSSFYTRLDVHH